MDNIQIILYVVFLIGYFLFKVLTGKKKPVTRKNPEKFDQHPKKELIDEEDVYDPTGRPKTFEEILEELAGGGQRKAKKAAPVVKQKAEEARQEVKEESVYDMSTREGEKYTKLDERVDLENMDFKVGEVEELAEQLNEKESVSANDYKAMLSNPDSARKAFVMSEIFNRKY